ncbi:MAG: family 78 glycoside hydrolase catalytic domain [Bacteroidales bacterium]
MQKLLWIIPLLFASLFPACSPENNTNLTVTALKTESAVNPLAIDRQNPRFSWQLQSHQRGVAQTAYQILVASSESFLRKDSADLWSSGKVTSNQSIGIPYGGISPESGKTYYWKVRVWDQAHLASEWSQPARFSMGLLSPADFRAEWIGLDRPDSAEARKGDLSRLAARYLRKEVTLDKRIEKATAYVCGQGLFEWYINGEKVGNQVLAPALSEFAKRSYYLTFDVTNQLKRGANVLGVILGNGRYYAPRQSGPVTSAQYGFPKLYLQLEITYNDGSTQTVISNDSWRITTKGPIIANNEFDGEEYNATLEMPGWNQPGFDDSAWEQAQVVAAASPILQSQPTPPITVAERIKPISVKELKPGTFIFDMGQNMVGWAKLTVKGERGTKVSMRFAETLQPDGSLYLANIRSAQVTDTYTLRGEGTETFEPRFTYHGFRYVEMTGFPGTPDLSTLEGCVVHDDLPLTGYFETSDTVINTIYRNAYWGIRGNYRSIPTDCPQRDERQGWLGDRATGSKGEAFVFDNSQLYAKWMQDIEDAQRADGCVPAVAPSYWQIYNGDVTWPAAYLIISDMLYRQFGDIRPISLHYDSFKKYIAYIKNNHIQNGIVTKDTYGDWCMPPERQELIHSQDPARKTDGAILSTTYFHHLLQLMEQYAALLNKPEDIVACRQLADTLRVAYNRKFYNDSTKGYGNNTATANLLSLAYGLVPEQRREEVFSNIVDKTLNEFNGHISTGLVGAQWIMRTLSRYGRPDIALKLTTNTSYPSWGYMAEKGATTIWELWNGNTADPAMNSGNHVMLLGDLLIWYYEDLAGIRSDPEVPAFGRLIMNPTLPEGLDYVKASYQSVRGLISSEWKKQENAFEWQITLPANTKALVYIPAQSEENVTESGIAASSAEGVRFLKMEGEKALFEVQSGSYNFGSTL